MGARERVRELYDTCSFREISLELTDAAMAQYLVNNCDFKVIIAGCKAKYDICKKYLNDILNIAEQQVDWYLNECYVSGEFCLVLSDESDDIEDKDIYETLLDNAACVVDLAQALRETVKEPFYNYFLSHKEEFIENIDLFRDNVSIDTYISYIGAFLKGDIYDGPEYEEKEKYFDVFDRANIETDKTGWINLGSCRGDTIFWSLLKGIRFTDIYSIEADTSRVDIINKNLSYIRKEDMSSIKIFNNECGIEENQLKLDNIHYDCPISLINMDIEGAEVSAILSGKELIKTDRPILAVCVYHKPDDLLTIPRIIKEICPDYRFELRKYLSGTGRHYNGVHRTNELVLYAIPDR